MIILDTNVISEIQKPIADPNVIGWLDRQDPTNLYLTSITVGELMFGAFSLPRGNRATRIQSFVANIVEEKFHGRILPYDATAAHFYGMRMADQKRNGIGVGIADGQIASIAIANNTAMVATRDTSPFEAFGLDVINPWDQILD